MENYLCFGALIVIATKYGIGNEGKDNLLTHLFIEPDLVSIYNYLKQVSLNTHWGANIFR